MDDIPRQKTWGPNLFFSWCFGSKKSAGKAKQDSSVNKWFDSSSDQLIVYVEFNKSNKYMPHNQSVTF